MPLASLRRITSTRPAPPAGERCEMCAEPIGDEHPHVVNLESRALMCTCRGCYLLFTAEQAQLRYRAVPDRYLSFPEVALGAASGTSCRSRSAWRSCSATPSRTGWVAFYPGPAGATESELPLEAWQQIVADHPQLGLLRPDVEALLVRGADREHAAYACHLVPIDACYELVGQLRTAVARLRRRPGGPRGDRGVLRRGAQRSRPAPAVEVP